MFDLPLAPIGTTVVTMLMAVPAAQRQLAARRRENLLRIVLPVALVLALLAACSNDAPPLPRASETRNLYWTRRTERVLSGAEEPDDAWLAGYRYRGTPLPGLPVDERSGTIANEKDAKTGVPVYSLYSETREPTDEMLAGLDALVIDLQDVGTRIYTYIYTMANCLRAARRHGIRVVVCDRPNPIGGTTIEGPMLQPGYESFVGLYPIALRHGLTIAEARKQVVARLESDGALVRTEPHVHSVGHCDRCGSGPTSICRNPSKPQRSPNR